MQYSTPAFPQLFYGLWKFPFDQSGLQRASVITRCSAVHLSHLLFFLLPLQCLLLNLTSSAQFSYFFLQPHSNLLCFLLSHPSLMSSASLPPTYSASASSVSIATHSSILSLMLPPHRFACWNTWSSSINGWKRAVPLMALEEPWQECFFWSRVHNSTSSAIMRLRELAAMHICCYSFRFIPLNCTSFNLCSEQLPSSPFSVAPLLLCVVWRELMISYFRTDLLFRSSMCYNTPKTRVTGGCKIVLGT